MRFGDDVAARGLQSGVKAMKDRRFSPHRTCVAMPIPLVHVTITAPAMFQNLYRRPLGAHVAASLEATSEVAASQSNSGVVATASTLKTRSG